MPLPSKNYAVDDDFSPMLAVGILVRYLPSMPLEHLLQYFTKWVENNHPEVLKRLSSLTGTQFLICPTDIPQAFLLTIEERYINCALVNKITTTADATISGPFLSLIDMMGGKVDGDALFFSRNLTVEGDTEALLTLRNAMDSEEIDIRTEFLQSIGPFKKPADTFLKLGNKLYQNLSQNMSIVRQAMTMPLSNRCDMLEQDNHNLQNQISHLEKALAKTQGRLQSISRKIKA